jgi:hypothetical protein
LVISKIKEGKKKEGRKEDENKKKKKKITFAIQLGDEYLKTKHVGNNSTL